MGALKLVLLPIAVVFAALGTGCASDPPREVAVKANEPWVYLHFVGSPGAALQRLMDDDWNEICRAPCSGPIPATGRFRILADVPGQPFSIPGATGSTVTLRAERDGKVYTLDSTQFPR